MQWPWRVLLTLIAINRFSYRTQGRHPGAAPPTMENALQAGAQPDLMEAFSQMTKDCIKLT